MEIIQVADLSPVNNATFLGLSRAAKIRIMTG